jgi:hypothetical protein
VLSTHASTQLIGQSSGAPPVIGCVALTFEGSLAFRRPRWTLKVTDGL